MAPICSEQELDDLLSEPSDADRAAMRAIEGGLLILGAGGKMGPSLAVVFLLTMPPAIELLSQRALPAIGIFVPIVSLGLAFPRLRALLLLRGSQRVLEDPRRPGGLPHRLPLDDLPQRPPTNVTAYEITR